jgi:hypothetical protein
MKELFETDYVIYDEEYDHVIQFSNGDIVLFGTKNEAEEDSRGIASGNRVVSCTDLPDYWKQIILTQINK